MIFLGWGGAGLQVIHTMLASYIFLFCALVVSRQDQMALGSGLVRPPRGEGDHVSEPGGVDHPEVPRHAARERPDGSVLPLGDPQTNNFQEAIDIKL